MSFVLAGYFLSYIFVSQYHAHMVLLVSCKVGISLDSHKFSSDRHWFPLDGLRWPQLSPMRYFRWCFLQLFIGSGHSLRMLLPLGLNMCPPFHSISKTLRGPSIIPPARTVIEDEIRRNAFWMAYATDRASMFGNGWAHAIDDEDVAQLLPVRGDQFNQGVCAFCLIGALRLKF